MFGAGRGLLTSFKTTFARFNLFANQRTREPDGIHSPLLRLKYRDKHESRMLSPEMDSNGQEDPTRLSPDLPRSQATPSRTVETENPSDNFSIAVRTENKGDKKLGRSSSSDKVELEKRKVMKNIFLISFAFLLNFNSFGGLARLQSSLHRVEGMGVITSSAIYGSLMASCMFLPKIIINYIGHKWTIAVSFWGYILYMAANGYAVWGTMIPGSILVGLCAAPLWTAQCSYFTITGSRYAKLNHENEDAVVSRFFGIFFMLFQISSITGSIISSTVLRPTRINPNETETGFEYCGVNDCPWVNTSNPNLEKPSEETVWTMVGIYIGIAVLAVAIIAVFVDNLPSNLTDEKVGLKTEVMNNFLATFKHLKHKEQWILIPLTMYSGFEQTFYSAEFSKSFVTCSIGIWKIGLVTLPFGIMSASMSYASGHVSKYIGRLPIFIFGMCLDLCIQFTLIFWTPTPDQEYVLYVLSAMWGLTDSIWQTQINTLYGVLFSKESEAAFANYRMWESLGFIIAFAYSSFLCTSVKLYVLTAVLITGMVGYFVVEGKLRKKNKLNTR